MLLRSTSPDEDIFTTMGTAGAGPDTNRLPSPPAPTQDVEGGNADDNNGGDDDDVWGSPDGMTAAATETAAPDHLHPSDIPRLRQEHVTSGYREGVTVAKAESIQAGFDEGYGLGATVGARAGKLLGLLEGIAAAVGAAGEKASGAAAAEEAPGEGNDAAAEAARLLERAREELSIKSVFGNEYWEADGTWKYDVPGGEGGDDGGEQKKGDADGAGAAIVFADVAAAHPLLRKWEALVQAEVERWGVDLSLLSEDAAAARDHSESRPKREIKPAPAQSRDALLW